MAQRNPSFSELINNVDNVDGFIRQKTLLQERLPFSAATLWRLIAAGRFPKPVKLSRNVTAWSIASVSRWEKDPAGYVETPQTEAQ